jgi:hypothetical protein
LECGDSFAAFVSLFGFVWSAAIPSPLLFLVCVECGASAPLLFLSSVWCAVQDAELSVQARWRDAVMEIQTFFLAERILPGLNRIDVQTVCMALVDSPPDATFPLRRRIPALVHLRRDSTSGEAPFSLRFDLVDEDGRAIGSPRHLLMQGVLPAEAGRFTSVHLELDFEFPAPGRYRLDVTLEEEFSGNVVSYNLDVTTREH